ncbi:MAG: DNA-directed RNA polymerase subunit K [Candidatus Hecatellales archaeon]|nr:MAG: DNA-directed RNA polymerase subunit K [Candidatus Hecatellales archaeon]
MSSEKSITGPPRLTRFERARIIGARALQISLGAPVLIEIPENVSRPIDIAKLELERGLLPITIRRKLPDGSYVDMAIQDLIQPGGERVGGTD